MRLVALLALSTLALAASSAGASSRTEQPYCLQAGDGAASVSLRAADGARLRGLLLGSGKLGIVLGHQVGSSSCEWYEQGKTFAAAGYRVLAIDFRGFGSSPVPARLPTQALDSDVAGAAAELRRRGARRVVAIGSSLGGTAVVVAAASRASRLDGVVSLSAPAAYYGLDALRAAKRLTVPARFLAARLDGNFPADARALGRAARSRDKAVLILPGGAHGTSLLENTISARRARAFVVAFLGRIAATA
ncbi:MAG: alpha/beta fold hydrolase [Actinobacteria bacterium]|nr:alpha/beta fold hydrolase [Actinomycetota bacterium]